MYAARKNFHFYNMRLIAKYTLRKNLEKAHIHQIWTKHGLNFAQKRPIWGNPGLFIVADYFLRKSIKQHLLSWQFGFYMIQYIMPVNLRWSGRPMVRTSCLAL